MEDKIKKLVLIDGNAVLHRAYHALPPLTTNKGELVNAVYGFSSTLLSVIEKIKPDYILAAFDLPGKTFRHEKFADYKAKRIKAPEDFYDQIPRVKEIVQAFNIPILEKEGYEADDIIGTIVKKLEDQKNLETIIVTGDLDTLQLVSPKTKVYNLRRGISETVLYDEKKIWERYGIKPYQITDLKGLCGDPSDNIPGVKGIGEKTAIELIKKYGSLEEVYRNINEIKSAIKEKLERDKAQALLSKDLASIRTDVPLNFSLPSSSFSFFDRKKILSLFGELNFYSLIKRLPDFQPGLQDSNQKKDSSVSGVSDFKYRVATSENAGDFLKEIAKQKEVSLFLKTSPANFRDSRIEGLAFCWKTGRVVYFGSEEMKKEKVNIKKILESSHVSKICYDIKHVYEVLKMNDIEMGGENFDIMLAAYCINPGAKNDLENLVLEELGEQITSDSHAQKAEVQSGTARIIEEVCQSADYIFKLKSVFEKKMRLIASAQGINNIEKIFKNLEMPLAIVLAHMEMTGIRFNKIIFAGISQKISRQLINLEKSIWHLAGTQFNINSPQQLSSVLFERLKLPTEGIKKIKTGFSTASTELEKLRSHHKIVEKIEEYREFFKIKTTYLDVLPGLVAEDGRIHTTYNQAVTATGRLSSSEPNLQNIPIRTDLGGLLRVAFEAEKGYRLISSDYSQIDLRVMAHESSDPKLIESFQKGEDIHVTTASEIFKVPRSAVTEKMRRVAKTLNFGILYGMSAFGFSQATGFEREESQKFISEYLNKFSGVSSYLSKIKAEAKEKGYVETELGRRRYIPEINSPNFQVQSAAERMAVNMPIQGLAADIMKIAMIKVFRRYENNPDVRLVLQVHDELILEVKEQLVENVAKEVKTIMENAYQLRVPLVVNVKIGDNWGEI